MALCSRSDDVASGAQRNVLTAASRTSRQPLVSSQRDHGMGDLGQLTRRAASLVLAVAHRPCSDIPTSATLEQAALAGPDQLITNAMETKGMARRPPWKRRLPSPSPTPQPHLPSLDLLLHVVMQEREKQLAHFDALDAKAGVLLAFDGVLIVVSRGIRLAFLLPGIAAASASGLLALAAFWPRDLPALNPATMRKYLTYATDETRLMLHDTTGEMVIRGVRVLQAKARNLKLALILLLLAAVTFGAGIISTADVTPHAGRTHHGRQEPARSGTSPSPSPSPSATPSRS